MKKCAIIGSDERFLYMREVLSADLDVKLFAKTIWDTELKNAIDDFQPEIIFLPIHPLTMEAPFQLPESCHVVFVGKKNEEMEKVFKQGNVHICNYLEDEQWIWDNANLTAEGFINYFYAHEKQSIYNKKFIITGYGRVGKRLAFALHHLGAEVIVSVRSEHQLFEAKSYGYQIETFKHVMDHQQDKTAYLINTIPSRWLAREEASSFNKIYDLASNPGCLLPAEESPPINYIHSTSLPGLYFPQDAGYLIARAVQTQLALLEGEK